MFNNVYKNKKALVTGHTGFKGSWLAMWLCELGAEVVGYALEPPTNPNHFDLIGLEIETVIDDVRNADKIKNVVKSYKPDIIFHLAAQSLVRRSYSFPVETFATNVMGTVNVLEACRASDSVSAVVNITSDKCYENREQLEGYRETDRLGGQDPYSASKGCAEIVTNAYLRSFFSEEAYRRSHTTLVATARSGNVIGGGDWAKDRLVPDIVRAASKDKKAVIRNPRAVRPWQHVLEPLSGYLRLGQRLLERQAACVGAWNFGPDKEGHLTVMDVLDALRKNWNAIDFAINDANPAAPHEAGLLKLDCSKARQELNWRPTWESLKMIAKTVQWYRDFYTSEKVTSHRQLLEYIQDAADQNIAWLNNEDITNPD
ncbi:CDP-glucose 4,6-dehydratase [Thermodesulfobacteriota bacterium]